ncbi:MAG TPA: sulfatase-like hydrolase/transferase, partial [Thermoanaerobaculia bacterium]|nr:sulfatase-like hydrolase/transferase [Thermoanaerobaculia bacterium]
MRLSATSGVLLLLASAAAPTFAAESAEERLAWLERAPDVLLVTVDTLRADHLSVAGYERPTTPNLDRLLGSGVRFEVARAVEPLTNPSLTSLLSSLPPHRHGATRNGIPARPDLVSLPGILERRGYATAAILGNWTLRDELSGLARHFETYRVIESR